MPLINPSFVIDFFSNIYPSVWWVSPAGWCNSWETENRESFQCDLLLRSALIAASRPGATTSVGSHQEKTFTLQKLLHQQHWNPKKTSKPNSLIDQSLKHGVSHEYWSSVLLRDPQEAALGSAVLVQMRICRIWSILQHFCWRYWCTLSYMKSGKIWEKYSKTVKIEQKIFNLHHIDASFIHSWHMCATFFFRIFIQAVRKLERSGNNHVLMFFSLLPTLPSNHCHTPTPTINKSP